VVTVDLLSTGVDIPDLEFIVFLRPVKSRILFEQMLGRGTRKGEHFSDKSHFVVFDCFDGTLLEYFRKATAITAEPPRRESRTLTELIEDIWQNRDRDYNVRCLVKRLQRINKEMSGDGRTLFATYVPNGDLGVFAATLPQRLREDFSGVTALLRNPDFQDLLLHYPRPRRIFLVAYETQDAVSSTLLTNETRPADYLAAFADFVRENPAQIEAIGILLERPQDWNTTALTELRQKLAGSPQHFTVENLQRAYVQHYHKALVDIISMVKHAADAHQPLYTVEERINLAFAKITAGREFSAEQQQWLDHIRAHLVENLSVDREDFDILPVFTRAGGWKRADAVFYGQLPDLLQDLNEAIAA
jgi:type I restriction enzyme R subunit